MITKSEAIARFLNEKARPDLAASYHLGMECQVNAAQDGGERIEGEYQGRKWHGWTDGLTTWKSFRIPWNAKSEPEFVDSKINWDLAAHVESIGMTGWDWKALRSRWVAYDFDAIVGHSDKHTAKLTNEELKAVQEAASQLEWVTVRRSTSGGGLHLYVYLDADIEVRNHTEHAALGRAILGKMAALTGFNFNAKVDNCGGNMWVWHRKTGTGNGLTVLKQGVKIPDSEIPTNWRDHVKVVSGHRKKTAPQDIESIGKVDPFDELSGQHLRIPLDDSHKSLIKFLQDNSLSWEWDQDNHMLMTHTIALKRAHVELNLKGYYATDSSGSSSINCFAFPLRRGSWSIRRYTPGVQEHASWKQDSGGWTQCYYNREPDLQTIALSFGGIEDPSGGFVFREAEMAQQAALFLGVDLKIAPALRARKAKLKQHKDGRLIVEIDRDNEDRGEHAEGFLADKTKWKRIYNVRSAESLEPESANYDDVVRHLVTGSGEDAGWVIRANEGWQVEPLTHIRAALSSMGMSNKEMVQTVGGSVFKAWKLVNKPFQAEFPGDREWNRYAAQLICVPTESDNLEFSAWTRILDHCGSGLDSAIRRDPWCQANGIVTGGDYLRCWVASLIQRPEEPLPYLFFYNEAQNTGKSIFHEALSLLFTKGCVRAEAALVSQQGFNAELEGAVVCIVEEVDLSKSTSAYNRIKDWVTSREMSIHRKGQTPYHVTNTSHWIQCANPQSACPVFRGDTRITMCFVKELEPFEMIPKRKLIEMLKSQVADFLASVTRIELPESNDRLGLPVIETEDKTSAVNMNLNPLEAFIAEHCHPVPGSLIKFADFYERFVNQGLTGESERAGWSKIRTGKSLPPQYPKGRTHSDPNIHIGNIAWLNGPTKEPGKAVALYGEYLEPKHD